MKKILLTIGASLLTLSLLGAHWEEQSFISPNVLSFYVPSGVTNTLSGLNSGGIGGTNWTGTTSTNMLLWSNSVTLLKTVVVETNITSTTAHTNGYAGTNGVYVFDEGAAVVTNGYRVVFNEYNNMLKDCVNGGDIVLQSGGSSILMGTGAGTTNASMGIVTAYTPQSDNKNSVVTFQFVGVPDGNAELTTTPTFSFTSTQTGTARRQVQYNLLPPSLFVGMKSIRLQTIQSSAGSSTNAGVWVDTIKLVGPMP